MGCAEKFFWPISVPRWKKCWTPLDYNINEIKVVNQVSRRYKKWNHLIIMSLSKNQSFMKKKLTEFSDLAFVMELMNLKCMDADTRQKVNIVLWL